MNIRNKATIIRLADFSSAPMRAFHMAWLAFFLCFFSWFGVAPLMPVIRQELHLTKAQTGNSIIASVALAVFGRLLMGWLCDRIGPRKTTRVAADPGLAAGDGHRPGARLHDLPDLPPDHRDHRLVVRGDAVSHLGDVRAERGGNGQRGRGGMGKPGRRSDADS